MNAYLALPRKKSPCISCLGITGATSTRSCEIIEKLIVNPPFTVGNQYVVLCDAWCNQCTRSSRRFGAVRLLHVIQ